MSPAAVARLLALSLVGIAAPAVTAGQVSGTASPAAASDGDPLARAERLWQANRLAEAHEAVDGALADARSAGDASARARAARTKGALLNWESRSAEARPWLEEALAGFEALGDRQGAATALLGLSVADTELGRGPAALAFAQRAVREFTAAGDKPGQARALLQCASSDALPAEDRERVTTEALELARETGDAGLVGQALAARANRRFASGDLAEAMALLGEAIPLLEAVGDVTGVAAARLKLGRVLRAHGDFDGALREYRQAADVIAPTGQAKTLVEAVNAQGVALNAIGRHEDAIAAYERGLAIARASGNRRLVDFMLGNLAGGYLKAGDDRRSVALLEEVLARGPDPYIAAFRHSQLGAALGHLGRFEEALPHATESVRLSRELGQHDHLEQRLATRAQLLDRLGRTEDALVDYRASLAEIEHVRGRLAPRDFLKRGFGEKAQAHYAAAIDLLARQDRFAEALEYAEQARGRALLDLLALRVEAPGTAAAGRTAGAGPDSPASAPAIALDEIRRLAGRVPATFLVYWVRGDATVIWVVGERGLLAAVRVAVAAADLEHLVSQASALPAGALRPSTLARADRSAWRRLHDALVAPVAQALPREGRVIVVPHGPVLHVPFGAMLDPGGRYLVERHDISYAPSLSVLAQTTSRPPAGGPWLLVGSPAAMSQPNGRALAPLPGAAREMRAIAAAPGAEQAAILQGRDASLAELRHRLAAATPAVLHLATHGVVLPRDEGPSFLVLSATEADDGRLTAEEIYGLAVPGSLVVLSACRSGAGPATSDGIVGLTRAFLAAGAVAVVASHWEVADEPTARLMRRFYREYVRHRDRGGALRRAQLALLADLRAGRVAIDDGRRRVTLPEHPMLWAGFFLSGAP